MNADVMRDVDAFLAEFLPLAAKAERQLKQELETSQAEAVLEETRMRAAEMSLIIQLAAVRQPDLRELLVPRQGITPEEHLQSMSGMRARVDANKEALKERKVEFKFDPAHAAHAVHVQAEAHAKAVDLISQTEVVAGGDQVRLVKLRKEGSRLQTRINKQLSALIEDDRGQQVKWGLTERESYRKKPADPTDETKKEKEPKKEKGKETTKDAAPASPGPVASGTAGQPEKAADAGDVPAVAGTPTGKPAEKPS